jgi:hypothetical protein
MITIKKEGIILSETDLDFENDGFKCQTKTAHKDTDNFLYVYATHVTKFD